MGGTSDIEKGEVDESVPVHLERKGHSQKKKKQRKGMTVEERKRTFNLEISVAESPLPFSCCIFRVPEVLRRQKKEAYTPDIVSIGPFHRGAKKLKLLENVKKWYLKCLFLPQRQGQRSTALSLDSLTERIKVEELDKRARGCYSDPCHHLDQDDFIEMLILDGCFLIELFRKAPSQHEDIRQDNDDPIFNMSCMLEYLYHDLLLLENQLPWFVLQYFYNLIDSGSSKLLREVVIDFFKDSVSDFKIFSTRDPKIEILHILDLIRTSLVHEHEVKNENVQQKQDSGVPITNIKKDLVHLPQRIPSAASLSEAGVEFKNGTSGCILNIKFEKGVFTIPPLAIDERTGPLFRNLMAYEQCYISCKHKITSYAVLMDNLIDTNEDVNLLCEKHIVANWLSADDAAKFFNDLYNDTTVIDFVYKELCENVHKYHEATWNRWREKLKRDYFDTPWATISFFAAFVLLVLTFLQTIYTIQPYYHPR
ncbi:hypothetical protein RchiOBHm_Chr2g0175051 [Rosa chinensis]|uniref:DUF247 domain protein n=2 Tax=Rosa chinensis TaxID=74649 RepID=A0A2P6S6B2_ROSCH|nr:hypothetical protein RchiOBHm_Chr2g0175051 [Rosa chinensis]